MNSGNASIKNSKILIIEDDFIGRTTLTQIFKKNGFNNLREAEDGKEGLGMVEEFRPDLIVTDVQMPVMDGLEFCAAVRKHNDTSIVNLPILVQSAITESSEKARIFSSGASDYISKPIDAQELIARTKVHLEREFVTRQLLEFNQRVRQELETAKSTQHILIPSSASIKEVEEIYHLKVHDHFQPCSELGGDFWTLNPINKDMFSLSAVDFSGHGVNAALNVFRLHAIMHGWTDEITCPGEYMTKLNAVLAPLLPAGQYATMFYGVVDTSANVLRYATAASPSPILFRRDGTFEILNSSGVFLGVRKDTQYEVREVPFSLGESLVLYSDALVETENTSGSELAMEDIVRILQPQAGHLSSEAFQNLLGHFYNNFGEQLSDDLTLVACCRLEK